MGADHTYRYVNTNTVYNTGTTNGYNAGTAAGYTSGYNAGTTAGYNTKKNQLTGTYTPTSNASNHDMGADHKYRYVNTNTVYNAGTSAGYTSGYNAGTKAGYTSGYNAGTTAGYNSGTAAGYTSGYNAGTTDGYNTKRNQLTGTYTPTTSKSNNDMGSNHNYRYVDSRSVYNAGTSAGYTSGYNAGTAAGYTSGYNAGTTAGYNTKKNSLTGTYTLSSITATSKDMGADHTYRYVKANYTTAIVSVGSLGDGGQASVSLSADGFYIISTSVDTRYNTSYTVTISFSNTTYASKVFSYEGNNIMKTYGVKVTSAGSSTVYIKLSKSGWYSVAKVY